MLHVRYLTRCDQRDGTGGHHGSTRIHATASITQRLGYVRSSGAVNVKAYAGRLRVTQMMHVPVLADAWGWRGIREGGSPALTPMLASAEYGTTGAFRCCGTHWAE